MVDTWQPSPSNNVIPVQKIAEFAALIKSQEEAKQDLTERSE